jgi:hypothetical protein
VLVVLVVAGICELLVAGVVRALSRVGFVRGVRLRLDLQLSTAVESEQGSGPIEPELLTRMKLRARTKNSTATQETGSPAVQSGTTTTTQVGINITSQKRRGGEAKRPRLTETGTTAETATRKSMRRPIVNSRYAGLG